MTTDHYDDSTTEDSTTDDTSEEPPMTTLPPPNSCDMTMRAYIHQFCQGYFSLPDCQVTTTESPPIPIPVYEDACKIPSKLVDPLFNNDTTTMALTVLEVNLKSTIYIFKNHLKQCFLSSYTPIQNSRQLTENLFWMPCRWTILFIYQNISS